MASTAPAVNHLLFANDSLLLFKSSVEGAVAVSNLLESYCVASGQRINHEKSSIFFSKGCPQVMRDSIKNTLNVQNESLSDRYLVMPTDVGHSKNGTFKYLRDRVWEKVRGWMEKLLSAARKEVLIKSVAHSLPTYIMGVFKLPFSVCDDLTSMVRNFYWGSREGKRKVHWRGWDHLLRPKDKGGAGFRDFRLFNQALLARQAW